MPVLRSVAKSILALSALSATLFAQNIHNDPQHRFTISVPVGWHVTTNEHEMKLTMGDSVIHIMHVDGQNSAANAAQIVMGDVPERFTDVMPTGTGETVLGGDKATFYDCAAYDDRSIAVNLHFTATDSGWVFFALTSQAGFSSLRDTFRKIEASFMLTKNIPSATPPPPTK